VINNSSFDKWNRLRQKELNHQFLNEIITGLNCSPFEAKAVLEAVYKIFGNYFETSGALKLGQIRFQVVSVRSSPKTPLKACQQVTVTLTLDAGEEDLKVKEQTGVAELRRHRIERVCHEAFQQGGLLTVEDLANRLFNCGERTLSRDLAYFRKHDRFIPLRSTVKDMGRAITHRVQIVKLWLVGKEYTEIARQTSHSIEAVRNYVDKFKRIVALSRQDFELSTVAFLTKVSSPLATEYLKIYQGAKSIVPSRQSELDSFFKKDRRQFERGGASDYAS
jgi:hypothetical protein